MDQNIQPLLTHIEACAEQMLQGDAQGGRDGLMFLSSWHEAMPALVHLDPVLEAIDVRVFAVLWIWGRQKGRGSTAFPTYAYLLNTCQIQSRATLARSLAILRITRWIALCRRVRDSNGRYRGNVYALHDEPLSLAGTLQLDSEYMPFLHDTVEHHHHDRVRRVARAMLDSLEEQVDNGEELLIDDAPSRFECRLEAIQTVNRDSQEGHYFGFSQHSLHQLKSKTRQVQSLSPRATADPVQKSNPDRVQLSNCKKMNSVRCSSSNLYIKNTTTNSEVDHNHSELSTDQATSSLIYPEALSDNERRLAAMHLRKLSVALQQSLLDELDGQIRSRKDTHNPIHNPIGFLCWLCNEAKADRIHLTSVGLRVQEHRNRAIQIANDDAAKKRELTEQARKTIHGSGSGKQTPR